jgi:hypothetical protein
LYTYKHITSIRDSVLLTNVNLEDEDLILVLTMGLPANYNTFVILLDATPPDKLTLNNMITQLLNEESRTYNVAPPNHFDNLIAATAAAPVCCALCPLALISCFSYGKKGHYQTNCLLKAPATSSIPATVTATTAAISSFYEPKSKTKDIFAV